MPRLLSSQRTGLGEFRWRRVVVEQATYGAGLVALATVAGDRRSLSYTHASSPVYHAPSTQALCVEEAHCCQRHSAEKVHTGGCVLIFDVSHTLSRDGGSAADGAP